MTKEELIEILKGNLKVMTCITYSECCGHEVHTTVLFGDEIISETTDTAEIIAY